MKNLQLIFNVLLTIAVVTLFALYVNGALVGTDLTGTTFSGTTLSRVDTNLTNAAVYSTASESINQALVFKTRLTNAELAELTTL